MNVIFSIVIPVYNSETYLEECLNSLTKQTYKNFEIILVNDGSKDKSLAIMRQYAKVDDRIKVISQQNQGISAARNVGLSNASGEYVIFIDSDDYLLDNNALQKLYDATLNKNDVVIYAIRYENNRHTRSLRKNSYKGEALDDALFHMIKDESLNSPCNKVFKRALIEKHTIRFDNRIKIGEDLLFNIEYFKHCTSAFYVADYLYFYRTSNESSRTSIFLENKYDDLMYVNDRLTEWVGAKGSVSLVEVAKYIRLKNILSCLRDLDVLPSNEKRLKAAIYKQDNPMLIVRRCGLKVYLVSMLYTYSSIHLLSKAIWKIFPKTSLKKVDHE